MQYEALLHPRTADAGARSFCPARTRLREFRFVLHGPGPSECPSRRENGKRETAALNPRQIQRHEREAGRTANLAEIRSQRLFDSEGKKFRWNLEPDDRAVPAGARRPDAASAKKRFDRFDLRQSLGS